MNLPPIAGSAAKVTRSRTRRRTRLPICFAGRIDRPKRAGFFGLVFLPPGLCILAFMLLNQMEIEADATARTEGDLRRGAQALAELLTLPGSGPVLSALGAAGAADGVNARSVPPGAGNEGICRSIAQTLLELGPAGSGAGLYSQGTLLCWVSRETSAGAAPGSRDLAVIAARAGAQPGVWAARMAADPGRLVLASKLSLRADSADFLIVRTLPAGPVEAERALIGRDARLLDEGGRVVAGAATAAATANGAAPGPIERIAGTNLTLAAPPPDFAATRIRAALALGIASVSLALLILGTGWLFDAFVSDQISLLTRLVRLQSRGRFRLLFRPGPTPPREVTALGLALNAMADSGAQQAQALRRHAAEESRLLIELHHRVKNNFQVVESLLSLLKKGRPIAASEHLRFIEDHVRAMAVADRAAYGDRHMRAAVATVVASVAEGLRATAGLPSAMLRLDLPNELGVLDLDRAVALCLCLAARLPAFYDGARASGQPIRIAASLSADNILHLEATGHPAEQSFSQLRHNLLEAYRRQLAALPPAAPETPDRFTIAVPNVRRVGAPD